MIKTFQFNKPTGKFAPIEGFFLEITFPPHIDISTICFSQCLAFSTCTDRNIIIQHKYVQTEVVIEKSRIGETKDLSTDADSSTTAKKL